MYNVKHFFENKIILFVFILFVLVVTIFQYISSTIYQKNETGVTRVGFVGTYRISDHDTPKPLEPDTLPSTRETNTVILTGHFDHDIKLNEQLFFKINYLNVTMLKSGVEIYRYGGEGSRPNYYNSSGKVWGRFLTTENMSTNDEITFILHSTYFDNYKSAYRDFFKFYIGANNDMMSMLFSKSMGFVIGAFVLIIIGIILLLGYFLLTLWHANVHVSLLPASVLIISGGFWLLCSDDFVIARVNNGIFMNFFATILLMVMTLCLTAYWQYTLKNKLRQHIAKIMRHFVTYCIVLFCLSQLFGLADPYYVRDAFDVFILPIVIVGIIMLGIELRDITERIEKLSFYYLIVFCVASLMEIINVPLEIFPTTTVLYIGGLIFLVMQVIIGLDIMHNAILRLQRAVVMERELAQSRISIMLSQIQPHFLYNALTAIKGICVTNPKKAEETIVSFSDYLRGNMDSLTQKEPIPFQQELAHTRNYLSIEQMRFQHKLSVEYHTPVTDFKLPALTLQPIVENAVRYGVTKKRGGGTVRITTEETGNSYVVKIIDDGVGFDPTVEKEDGRTHIGIVNVRDRLKTISGGSLEIESVISKGTTAVITVPKEVKTNES